MAKSVTQTMLKIISEDEKNVSLRLANALGISRQASSLHLRLAILDGLISKIGNGRGVKYKLIELEKFDKSFNREGLDEYDVWSSILSPVVKDLPENVRDVWQFGFTEMVNNAIDHSEAITIEIMGSKNALYTQVWVADNGIGIFNKIQKALNLYDPREAILELAKGKVTTAPEKHSGEGIFFSSKMFDNFVITSGNLHFFHDDEMEDDFLFEHGKQSEGTKVYMRLMNDTEVIAKKIFDKFSKPEKYTFEKTIVPVKLAQYEGEKLISRSQAKRLIYRFDKFKTVILDFNGVAEIGQSFADEVFRVFQNTNPSTKLVPTNTTKAVKDMISRAKAHVSS